MASENVLAPWLNAAGKINPLDRLLGRILSQLGQLRRKVG